MKNKSPILVVDDEEIVCDSCTRILAKEGYLVHTITDPQEGLRMVGSNDYSAILLDLKMREMDGLEFLDQLRKKNSEVPVIIITGYPTQESANASTRLGVSDYLPKPFTPDEIAESVRRATTRDKPERTPAAAVRPSPAPASWESFGGGLRFLDEAWLRIGEDASVRAGAVLPRLPGAPRSIKLPEVGEVVYRGLPLAAVEVEGQPPRIIPSPVSGEVLEVNREIAARPQALLQDPCGEGWIARIRPARLDDDLPLSRTRLAVLASRSAERVADTRARLEGLGCKTVPAGDAAEVLQGLKFHPGAVLFLDAFAFGGDGPDLVSRVNLDSPGTRVVVLADTAWDMEAEYRARKILYYAVKPFEDQEILDILFAAFRAPAGPARTEEKESKFLPKWVSRIHITNRHGTRVTLLSFGEALLYHKGLGRELIGKILDRSHPIETTRGVERSAPGDSASQARIAREADGCDRLLVLLAEDSGRLPGSLSVGPGKEAFGGIGAEATRKMGVLKVQPEPGAPPGPISLDPRTTDALADHMLKEMVSR